MWKELRRHLNVLAACALMSASPALAQQPAPAGGSFEDAVIEGIKAFKMGDYAEAIKAFELAHAINPQEPTMLYNLARAYHKSDDCENALENYTAFLENPGHVANTASTQNAKKYIQELRAFGPCAVPETTAERMARVFDGALVVKQGEIPAACQERWAQSADFREALTDSLRAVCVEGEGLESGPACESVCEEGDAACMTCLGSCVAAGFALCDE